MKKLCNCCGREFQQKNEILLEDVVAVEKNWGYFSQKDGEHHTFYLCEQCYDRITKHFQIPVEVTERTELL